MDVRGRGLGAPPVAVSTSELKSPTKAEATRVRVLDAAAKVFREKGYIGAPLSDIAKAAHLKAGSLYYHFPSREAMVEEVIRVGQERIEQFVRERLDELPARASAVDRLRTAITAHGIAVLELGDYTPASIRIVPHVPEEIRERSVTVYRRYLAEWEVLFANARRTRGIRSDLDLSTIRFLVLGALYSAADWYDAGRGLPGDELSAQFAEVVLGGLAGFPRGKGSWRLPIRLDTASALRTNGAGTSGQPRRTATRLRIFDAAAQVFHEQGYVGARLTDIAAAAGLQAGSLYYHFSSREELVTELFRLAWEHTDQFVRACVGRLPQDASELDRLGVALCAQLVSSLDRGTHTSAVVKIMPQVPDTVLQRSRIDQRSYIGYLRAILQRAAAAGELRADLDLSAALMMVLGALNWTPDWYDPNGAMRPQEIAAQWVSVIFDGLGSMTRTSSR